MSKISKRILFSPLQPYRTKRPATSKIIFLSCEGAVTEEEYFKIVGNLFSNVKTRIQFISVNEEIVKKLPKYRSKEENKILSQSRPYQLLKRIDDFKIEKESVFEFSKHLDDEFWLVFDVDDHTEARNISEWNATIDECKQKDYGFAISNPFFEVWLLLHHDDIIEADKNFAVTDTHKYEATAHFRERLESLGVPLKNKKSVNPDDYNVEKIKVAVNRAKLLFKDNEEWPHNIGSTVYKLVEKIIDMSNIVDNIKK